MNVTSRFPMLTPAVIALCVVTAPLASAASILISEFMAQNGSTLKDSDGEHSDWVELCNAGTATVDLAGWHLTDDALDLTKWTFPATNMPPGSYLLVFASDKDRAKAGEELHANFKLTASGEYLGLVMPDGATVSFAYAPRFPEQVADLSYGISGEAASREFVPESAACRALVPANAGLGTTWVARTGFNDSGWITGDTGVGYGANYTNVIGLNIQPAMYNSNSTCYIRVPFQASNVAALTALSLDLRYDDGFVAHLNGVRVAAAYAPTTPAWNSMSTGSHDGSLYETFNITAFKGALVNGANVLAFQALNTRTNGPDLLILPRLRGVQSGIDTNNIGYFHIPTPGQPNGATLTNIGAVVKYAGHAPLIPAVSDTIVVTAQITAIDGVVAAAALRYRVMFGAETAVPMYDDGAHGDGLTNDGCFAATIASGIASPGQMIRYRIVATNSAGVGARWPLFMNPTNSPEYLGTVVHDPAVSTNIPVYHWFVQNTAAADTRTGARCSLFYDGEFYDNLFCRLRGGSSSSQTKKPHKIEFNDGYDFRALPGEKRVDEINLNAAFDDPTYMRDFLSWETFEEAKMPYCFSYHLQLRQNGAFHSLAVLVEQVDKHFLRRHGFDDRGALYKAAANSLFLRESATSYEKKTPDDTNYSDLQGLISMLTSSDAAAKRRFAYDQLNLPEIINFLAANVLLQDWDYGNKNYYMYRDTYGSGEWTIFGWDKNLTFGYIWDNANVVANNDTLGGSNGRGISSPYWNSWNALYGLIFNINTPYVNIPDFLPLYARRARTLMDTILQAPGTPGAELKFEKRIEQLRQMIKPLADADRSKWGWPASSGFFRHPHYLIDEGCTEMTNLFLAPRRVHLFVTHNVGSGSIIPNSQPASANLLFGTVEPVPASGNQDEEYIELRNTNTYAADISGWRLSNAVEHTFQPGVVVPAGGSLYVSPRVSAFRARSTSPRSNEYRFVQGNYKGQLSSWGETIYLLDDSGAVKNSTMYPPSLSAPQRFLRVSEIMYHPADPPAGSPYLNDDFEFVELCNIGAAPLNVSGTYFSAGIQFSFGPATFTIPAGGCVVIVNNLEAFETRYDTNGMRIAGTFAGKLDNAGEHIETEDPRNETIQAFTFDPAWYPVTDGGGRSLEIVSPDGALASWDTAEGWCASGQPCGTPGYLVPEPACTALLLLCLAGCCARGKSCRAL
ncbi:hypothetical protein GX586_09565 [bacterium]|nr:hypothetical protein [bacterium]